ncbi:epstein-barr virus ebna-1-like protein [Hordeum vulgare]|nr:epstein-barr virus ebna-1-like protein [Hordeum vulgare]
MSCDGKKHIPSNLDDNMDLWKKLEDRNDTKITFKGLLAKMKGINSSNFARPFVLYTIGKYVCRTKEEYVHNKYIVIARNVETIKGTNLAQLRLDNLMDSLKNYVNDEAILEGNLPLLQTWYYEKFRVHQLDSSIWYESRLRPLIQNWSEEKAKKYVEHLMRPFILAQDGTLAKPMTRAQIKVLVRRVLTDLQEVASLVREAGAERVDRMYTFEKNKDECLRPTCTNGKLTEDLVKELNVVDFEIELMRHDEPTDTRDGQLVYIERVAGVVKLERDGMIEKCYKDVLARIPGTTQGTNYVKHDMVRGMEAHLRAAMRINGIESNAWEDINVTQCVQYMLKNIELFTGEKLRMQYDQVRRVTPKILSFSETYGTILTYPRMRANIDEFRRELHVALVDSPYKKMKYRKRFKQYHARLSDATAVEDDEDASS